MPASRCSAPIPKSISPMRSAERAWTWCKPTLSSTRRSPRRWWQVRRKAGAPRSTSWRKRSCACRAEPTPLPTLPRMRGRVGRGVHATFHLERTYDAPVARVWKALTDEAAKQKWFGGARDRWELLERRMDVRVGGNERVKGRWEGGVVSIFDAIYHDVSPNERLVYSYEMHLNDKKISVSLATMQLKADGGKTILKVSEQGAFLDGYDDAGSREHGTGH